MKEKTTDSSLGSRQSGGPSAAQQVKSEVSNLIEGAKGEASKLVESVKTQATGAAEQEKKTATGRLSTVAGALREVAHKLEQDDAAAIGAYASGAADQVDRVTRYLEDRDLEGLTRDTETFARRHPELFLGGAFVAGLLVARFLKSSGMRSHADGTNPDLGPVTNYDSGGAAGDPGKYEASPVEAGDTSVRWSRGPSAMPTQPLDPPYDEPAGGQSQR